MRVIYSVGARLPGPGIGYTAYNALRGIHRHGFLRKVYCQAYAPCDIPREIVKLIRFPSRRFIPLSQTAYYRLKDCWFDRRVSNNLEGCDIFHAWAHQSLNSLRRAKQMGAVCFVERASSHPRTQLRLLQEEADAFGLRGPGNLLPLIEKMEKEFELADRVLVPSPFARDSMLAEGVREEKLILLPFGADVKRFIPARNPTNFTILFVGELSLRKGVPYLLEAWTKLKMPHAKLVLLGGIEEQLLRLINDYRKRKHFDTPGFGDPLPYYHQASVFVFPSIEEGSALVTYEAMACGLPVITTYNSGSVVQDGIEGFIVPIRDPDSIASSIEKLTDEELRRAMSESARRRACQFTWENYGNRLVNTYREVLNR